jgi:hypothetical protein
VANEEPFNVKGNIARSTLRRDNVITVRATEVITAPPFADGSNASRLTASTEESQTSEKTSSASPDETELMTPTFSPQGCPTGRHEVTMQLDPGSVFDASMGRGLPVGFERFPQGLLPGFDLRFSALTIDELRAAVQSMQLLQSISVPRLHPEVFGPSRSHTPRRPTFYIGPPSAELKKLLAPILPSVNDPLGDAAQSVLEGFAGNGDDHLALVTNGAAALLVETLAEPANNSAGWRSLKGDVLIHQNGEVRNLRLRQTRDGEQRGRLQTNTRIGHALFFGFGAGWILAIFSALVRFLRRRISSR